MLICIYTREKETSSYASKYLSERLQCPILVPSSPELCFPHQIKYGVLTLASIAEWKKYEVSCSLLLIIFTEHADPEFYDDVCALNKFTYKIQYINGSREKLQLRAQLDRIRLEIRPAWETYFMDIATFVSHRSACAKRNVGAVLVKGNRIVSTGYNGTAMGTLNCIDGGCPRCCSGTPSGSNLDLCVCLHAEESAMMGVVSERLSGCDLYVTLFPCMLCAKKIIQAQIKRVIFKNYYCASDVESRKLLEELKIEVKRYIEE
ncbi:Deoxycytidylate deaminase [Trachipleistophora hominis]|uniref:dCMP deaminase n=1 Tax=Trachipleistophora hominis TaxID=72359 RepID=L7JUT8_TRAHO|nr:Deoxycytidylate deaminase [Trachipleistophora hominis]